jgi:ribA/ribD-fused uncharacterized protein
MNGYRIYNLNDENIIYFRKTKEKWGGLSNMAYGYPIVIDNELIYSSEALYQAIKFTSYPDIQKEIILPKSPMHAKMIAKKYKSYMRKDWDFIKVKVMRWALLIKLMFNYNTFGELLKNTDHKIIVELSHRDKFWGTVLIDNINNIAEGENVLGRLLMEIREKTLYKFNCVPSPSIYDFRFLGKTLKKVYYKENTLLNLIKSKYNQKSLL